MIFGFGQASRQLRRSSEWAGASRRLFDGADTTGEIRFTSVWFQRKQKRSDYGSGVRGIRFRNRLIDDRRDRIEIAAEMLLSPCFQIRFEGDSLRGFCLSVLCQNWVEEWRE